MKLIFAVLEKSKQRVNRRVGQMRTCVSKGASSCLKIMFKVEISETIKVTFANKLEPSIKYLTLFSVFLHWI